MSTFKPSRQMRRMQIVALLLLVASGIVNYLDRSALSIANIEVRQELGLSATAMGVLLSAFLMSYAFSQLPAGILVDRIGPRILLGVGLVIWSVAQGAAGLVTSYAQFFAARIGLGVGESPQFPTGARVVSNWFHVKERGFPTGIFNSAPSIGTALAPPILTWLMLAYGWRIMFIVMGVVGLVVAAAWFLFYRDADQHGTAGRQSLYPRRRYRPHIVASGNQTVGAVVQMPNDMGHDHRQLRRRLSDVGLLRLAARLPGNSASHEHRTNGNLRSDPPGVRNSRVIVWRLHLRLVGGARFFATE